MAAEARSLISLSQRILGRGKQLLALAERVPGPERQELLDLAEGLLADATELADAAAGEKSRSSSLRHQFFQR
jgi:hypothetical protein